LAIAGIAALLVALLVAGTALAQGQTPWGRGDWNPGNWGPGMMGGGRPGAGDYGSGNWQPGSWGRGMMGRGMTLAPALRSGTSAGVGGFGPGGWGQGMMNPGQCPWWNNGTPAGEPLTPAQAQNIAEQAVAGYGNPDLEIAEIMQFSRNFYVLVKEKSTGKGAFELLINPYSGAVHPEPGPNMMWNTRYGHMGGMMGGWFGRPIGEPSITPEQAVTLAQAWLDSNLPGATASDDDVVEFYGYYTLHTLRDDQINGMLSVNAYTGQLWYHNWHGEFIAMIGEHSE
jgi:hypothetical protein